VIYICSNGDFFSFFVGCGFRVGFVFFVFGGVWFFVGGFGGFGLAFGFFCVLFVGCVGGGLYVMC